MCGVERDRTSQRVPKASGSVLIHLRSAADERCASGEPVARLGGQAVVKRVLSVSERRRRDEVHLIEAHHPLDIQPLMFPATVYQDCLKPRP